MPYSSAQASRSVEVLAYSVSLTVSPSGPWKPGQRVTLYVKVVPSEPGIPVDLMFVIPGKVSTTFAREYTDDLGRVTYAWTIPWTISGVTVPCNRVYFRAGEAITGAVSNDVYGDVAYNTRISISAPDTVGAGADFTVSGKLEYESASGVWSPLADRTVDIYYDGTRLASVSTGSDGSYRAVVSIPSAGTYTLKAVYAGEGFTMAVATRALATLEGLMPIAVMSLVPVAFGGALALMVMR